MVQRTIRIRRIHNQTKPTVPVHVPRADGSFVTSEPGETLDGPWLVEYDPDEHPEVPRVDEAEWYFIDSPFEFTWSSVAFPDTEPTPVDFGLLYDEEGGS